MLAFKIYTNPNWQGAAYHKNSEPQKMWFESFAGELPLKGHEDVLDIGCGDGKLTLEIAGKLKTGSILGIDISNSMIEFAKTSYKQKNLSFAVGDARKFNLNKKFDLILSFTALHWVKEYEQIIQRAKEHLKPNGRIFFVFPTKFNYFPIGQSLNALYANKKWSPYFKNYDPGYYAHDMDPFMDSLIKNGFAVNEMFLKSKLNIFETAEKMFSWLKTWFPQQSQVPAGLGDQFIREFIEEYAKHGTKNTKGIHWEGFLLKVDASLKPAMPENPAKSMVINAIK
jgi:trans-aconitate methyltransferase